jgi:hypothetical protein
MQGELRLIVAACAIACAFAVPAAGAAAVGPVDHFHNVFADSGNVCGIDVAETESISGVFTIVGNGVELNAYSVQNTWTSPATGKSVDFHAAVLNTDTFSSPTDNGDGTISFFFEAAGWCKSDPTGRCSCTARVKSARSSRSTARRSRSSRSRC